MLRCLLDCFLGRPADECRLMKFYVLWFIEALRFKSIAFHLKCTSIKSTPVAYGCKMEEIQMPIEAIGRIVLSSLVGAFKLIVPLSIPKLPYLCELFRQ